MNDVNKRFKLPRSQLIGLVLLLLLAATVLPQLSGFKESLNLLKTFDWFYALFAMILIVLTYFAAAATYCFLAFKPISYFRTVIAQFAAMFVNRLVPAGVGAVGLNYAYLRKCRHSVFQAGAVVSVNNLFGLIGNIVLVGTIIIFFGATLPPVSLPAVVSSGAMLGAAMLLLFVGLLAPAPRLVRKLAKSTGSLLKQIAMFRHRPIALILGLFSSTLLTLLNVLSLYLCLLAVGGHLSIVAVAIIFTLGVGAGSITPTPGGLGGLEAALVAGFIFYHVPSATAIAAVILFRVLSYWITLAIGAFVFIYCQRRDYFSFS